MLPASKSLPFNSNQSQLKKETGEWLHNFHWDMWTTLTFRFEVRDPLNATKYFHRFIGDLDREVSYFMAVERFKHNSGTHLHALLDGVDDLTYVSVGKRWFDRYGFAYIRGYDPALGASHYISKYITKELCDWDFNFRNEGQKRLF